MNEYLLRLGKVKGRYVRRCLVRAMYLSAPEVAVSILGVTVGQLVHFVVSCFLNSRSGFLYTFCVYSPCSVNWNDCARRLDARVTIM